MALSSNGEPVTAPPGFQTIVTLIESVRSASFPMLRDARIEVLGLHSDFDYLQTRFTLPSYFFSSTLRYMIMFNPEALRRQAPAEGLRAIVAHELAHIDYFRGHSRPSLLQLVMMLSPSFATRFERQADLEAIALRYGPGLQCTGPGFIGTSPPHALRRRSATIFPLRRSKPFFARNRRAPES